MASAASKRGGGFGNLLTVSSKSAYKQREQKETKKQPKSSVPSTTRRTYRNRTTSQDTDLNPKQTSPNASPTSIISTIIFGNIKFQCVRNEFKCIECGESDLRTHYRKDYTCHQCFYNTSCSKSFEYHLHGHLDKKRTALWNKPIKTQAELYKCPCGFKINSDLDNNFDASTGNMVAAHLLKCKYKYCKFSSKSDDMNAERNHQVETNENSDELTCAENENATKN